MAQPAAKIVCLGLVLLVFASGCAGIVNPHISLDTTVPPPMTLEQAIQYADLAKTKYKDALGSQAKLYSWLGIGLIPLMAASAGLGIANAPPMSVAATALTGVAGYSVGIWLYSKPNQRAWVAGYNATSCAVSAVIPLWDVARRKVEIQDHIDGLDKSRDGDDKVVGVLSAKRTLQERIAEAAGDSDNPYVVEANKRVKEADDQLATTAITRGNANKMLSQAETAGLLLKETVDRIAGQVSGVLVEAGPDLSALASTVGGLAQTYRTFAAVPEALKKPPADTKQDSAKAKNQAKLTINKNEAEKTFPPEARENLEKLKKRRDQKKKNLEELEKKRAALPPAEAENLEKQAEETFAEADRQKLENLENLEKQAEETFPLEAREELEKLEKLEEVRKALNALNMAMGNLVNAYQKVADDVDRFAGATPIETLRACGVTADQVTRPLSLDPPGEITFEQGKAGVVGRVVKGGAEPFSIALQGTLTDLTERQTEPFGPAFIVQTSEKTPAGKASLLVSDRSGNRFFVQVTVTADPKIEALHKLAESLKATPTVPLDKANISVKVDENKVKVTEADKKLQVEVVKVMKDSGEITEPSQYPPEADIKKALLKRPAASGLTEDNIDITGKVKKP